MNKSDNGSEIEIYEIPEQPDNRFEKTGGGFKYSPAVKAVIAIFAAASFVFAAVWGISAVYMYDQGYYDPKVENFFDTQTYGHMLDIGVRNVIEIYENTGELGYFYSYYFDDDNLKYELFLTEASKIYSSGNMQGSEFDGTRAPSMIDRPVEIPETPELPESESPPEFTAPDDRLPTDNTEFSEISKDNPLFVASNYSGQPGFHMSEHELGGYIVRTYTLENPGGYDRYGTSLQLFKILYPIKDTAVPCALSGLSVFVIFFAFGILTAGRTPESGRIKLMSVDRVPLDLLLFLCGFPMILSLFFAVETFFYRAGTYIVTVGVMAAVFYLFGMTWFLSFVRRIKAGDWHKNTLVYRIWSIFCRVFGAVSEIVRRIPITWKAMLAAAGTSAVYLFLIVIADAGAVGGALVLWAVFSLFLVLAAGYLCLGLRELKLAGERMAAGDFETPADPKFLRGSLSEHALNLTKTGEGALVAIEQKMRSERLKTELITNVSHDIKTPLTSIINYVDLLRELSPEEPAKEYVDVLVRNTARLKKLTEDLIEASKASTGNLPVELVPTDIGETVRQAVGEYRERLEAANLEPVLSVPDVGPMADADGKHLWRVFDNLLINIVKYSLPGTRVYFEVGEVFGEAFVTFKNISRDMLGKDADELTERFVRGDGSRSEEGSGLGLSIARSLTELQNARFELFPDGDLFKVRIVFRKSI